MFIYKRAPLLRVTARRALENGKISSSQYHHILSMVENAALANKNFYNEKTMRKVNKNLISNK